MKFFYLFFNAPNTFDSILTIKDQKPYSQTNQLPKLFARLRGFYKIYLKSRILLTLRATSDRISLQHIEVQDKLKIRSDIPIYVKKHYQIIQDAHEAMLELCCEWV